MGRVCDSQLLLKQFSLWATGTKYCISWKHHQIEQARHKYSIYSKSLVLNAQIHIDANWPSFPFKKRKQIVPLPSQLGSSESPGPPYRAPRDPSVGLPLPAGRTIQSALHCFLKVCRLTGSKSVIRFGMEFRLLHQQCNKIFESEKKSGEFKCQPG